MPSTAPRSNASYWEQPAPHQPAARWRERRSGRGRSATAPFGPPASGRARQFPHFRDRGALQFTALARLAAMAAAVLALEAHLLGCRAVDLRPFPVLED